MFERFTDRARRVVVEAQQEARALDHNYIGTEHLLLALIREGNGLGAKALESLGVRAEALRAGVAEMVDPGQQSPSAHIPFTPRAKQVLRLALGEALRLGHNYIGTEHLLLALIQERDGVAGQVLAAAGADLERVRAEVERLLAEYQRRTGPDAGGS
jgi:ATP-dependent Clp protease ATP-binding subunit ClpC